MQTATRRKEANVDIKQTLIRLYNEGKCREEAMEACNFDLTWDNNRMSILSSRLKLDWSVPPERRQSGKKPAPQRPASKAKAALKAQKKDAAKGPAAKPIQTQAPPAPAPAQGETSAALVSGPFIRDAPKGPSAEIEKTLDPRRFTPSPGFSSARTRRERGIDDSRFEPPRLRKEDEAERYLNRYFAEKFG